MVDRGGAPPFSTSGFAVLHGHAHVDVHAAGGGATGTAGGSPGGRVALFRGLLGPEPTRRWGNDTHVIDALRKGCFQVAPWPLSTANEVCTPGADAPALVARARVRQAFWPGDKGYRYVFHDVMPREQGVGAGDANAALRAMVQTDLPVARLSRVFGVDLRGPLRVNNFYLGSRGTGSVLHIHSAAINALAVGEKIWVTAPQSSMDTLARFHAGRVLNKSMADFVLENLDVFVSEVPGSAILVQRAGDVVYLPHYTFHATVNLQYNVGSAFSWTCEESAGCAVDGARVMQAQGQALAACTKKGVCDHSTRTCGCV